MDQIKAWYRSIPLWLAIFLFAGAALLLSSLLSDKLTEAAYGRIMQINLRYLELSTEQETTSEITYHAAIGTDGEVAIYRVNLQAMPTETSRMYHFYQWIARYGPPLTYAAGLLCAALLFYFSKLRRPLKLLQNASAKIAETDLDFSLHYAGHDEMAKLCGSFEKMRSALEENNRRMLRMIDERQQLNDAYTHDLRTPIAVLKGYTELLSKYLPEGKLSGEEVLETVHTMSAHVARLEQFVAGMNAAQRITDLTIRRERVPTGDFLEGLRETAAFLCAERGLACRVTSELTADTLNIDPAAVTQVFENLMSNAARFASSRVNVQCSLHKALFSVRVTDDGAGFSGKELVAAANPYYTGRQEAQTYHFGLGLFICRTLCEKHGGTLALANADGGGAAVTASFAV